jgi:redox-sensing transcriptional repressor
VASERPRAGHPGLQQATRVVSERPRAGHPGLQRATRVVSERPRAGHPGLQQATDGGEPDFVNECTSGPRLGARHLEPPSYWSSAISELRRIPEATVARLPLYYRALLEIAEQAVATVSSEQLAELAGVNAAKVRKDLSYLGSYGTRGVGYDVTELVDEIAQELGLTHDWPVTIVGLGNLGHALANYRGFGARGFRIVALVDADAAKVGDRVGDLVIESIDDLDRIVADRAVAIGVIATPAGAAQDVADRLVAAGVGSILNFAPAVVTVPPGVSLRKVDLATELQILSFYQQHRPTAASAPDGARV